MDERQRIQLGLIVAYELDLAKRATVQAGRQIYAEHSAKGSLGSGATIKVVSQAVGSESDRLLANLIERTATVSRSLDAFELVANAMETHFGNVAEDVVTAARMASRRGQGDPIPSMLAAAETLFEQVKSDIRAKLAIERFGFDGSLTDTQAQLPTTSNVGPAVNKNHGGKPLAAHWDELWSSIAVQLWNGDLQPKTQADIKRAMLEWFTAKEIDVGETAVTDRARQLWLKIEATK